MVMGEMGGVGKSYLMKLVAAFFLTAGLGLMAAKMGLKLPEDPRVIAWTLIVGGGLILGAEAWLKRHQGHENPGWGTALVIGASQMLAAVFPGTSRSGVTILAGMFGGLSRSAAADFSFLLGVPTLLVRAGLVAPCVIGARIVPECVCGLKLVQVRVNSEHLVVPNRA